MVITPYTTNETGKTLYAKELEKTYMTQENTAMGYSCLKVSNMISTLRSNKFSSDSKVLKKEAIKRCLTNYTFIEKETFVKEIVGDVSGLLVNH
jgi:hypothetical protein